ncbi:5'-methylthioadenosine/adenosylhomocysteine nucleosidase [Paenibacillus larvae]|uniref:adenosylhomocysteine nucleosidase n=1 Tax=Paenibacillus larvae TaxID=1464 RepID=A0AAP5JYA2_9BACL|nr:5'-methylthioadenosine/adenosylhomocysteine nucleosidase [Paenibacillus larvae]AQR76409.1 5'-methylthioadenosine/S-adenosylhomocysteine nucleosidase [Paenibacillus larvae subsp. larvae]AVF22765.1 MTA/SAH nucleosidase MtnN [Paenibacillus larvae subsp. larvae]ETK25654.1 MTA/SAH nucleosidase MtnN [Paenibacillus larvae subsp. larvae DSM 25719]MCY7488886.1 5'-methylthioadenosine/adenosylhomocysteine nucleosidase [Paenibacillus larvae]MCY9562284.1 5'-methylthioadenosine/adenosylhomocysteine nucle
MEKIAVIGAMKEEIELLVPDMEVQGSTTIAGIEYREGSLYGKAVVLCMSGVGKVNAAVCTQILVDRFQADTVIFTGVAGALDPELTIGDIVISSDCIQHDMDVTALGFERGVIPYAETSVFKADSNLIELARFASKNFEGRTKVGRILSGDQFVAIREMVGDLHKSLQGTCTEMEGAAVAQVCHMNGIPFVIIRSMSDQADGKAHVNFAEFTVKASEHSYQIVKRMLTHM